MEPKVANVISPHATSTPNFPPGSSHELLGIILRNECGEMWRNECWGLCGEIGVGPPFFTLLQPEMLIDGARSGRCDQPLTL